MSGRLAPSMGWVVSAKSCPSLGTARRSSLPAAAINSTKAARPSPPEASHSAVCLLSSSFESVQSGGSATATCRKVAAPARLRRPVGSCAGRGYTFRRFVRDCAGRAGGGMPASGGARNEQAEPSTSLDRWIADSVRPVPAEAIGEGGGAARRRVRRLCRGRRDQHRAARGGDRRGPREPTWRTRWKALADRRSEADARRLSRPSRRS